MRRRLPLFRTVVVLTLALLVGGAALLVFARVDRVVVAPGELVGGSVAVRAALDGRVVEVLVEPGGEVEAGDVLLRLDAEPLENERARARARIAVQEERARTAHAEETRLVEETHPSEQLRARREVEVARITLEGARTRASRLSTLAEEGLATELEAEEAETDRALAAVALTDAEEAIARLELAQRAQLEAIRAEARTLAGQLLEERAGLEELERQLRAATVLSNCEGVVAADDLHELEGKSVHVGEELLRIATTSVERFEGVLPDAARALVQPGTAARIRLDGYPWLIHGTLPGRVTFVSERSAGPEGFTTLLSIDRARAPGPLFEGMKGQARLVVEEDVSPGRLLIERLTGLTKP